VSVRIMPAGQQAAVRIREIKVSSIAMMHLRS
jgi:hypothetical protein